VFLVYGSWILIFLLVTWKLAAGVFPALYPRWGPTLIWGAAFAAALLFFASVLAHERAHSLVARANGIPVRDITLFLLAGCRTFSASRDRQPPISSTSTSPCEGNQEEFESTPSEPTERGSPATHL
jgi:Zn-dependent protease